MLPSLWDYITSRIHGIGIFTYIMVNVGIYTMDPMAYDSCRMLATLLKLGIRCSHVQDFWPLEHMNV